MNQPNKLASKFNFFSLLKYAAPTMCMMVFMGLYTIVDTIFVSRFVNADALAAINICTPILYMVVGIAAMLSTGASAIIGRKMGEGNLMGARQTFSFIVLCGFLFALAVMVAGLLFIEPILRTLGASERLAPYCMDYLQIQFLFVPANMLGAVFQNLFVAAGRPGLGMALSLSAGGLNIALDYLFIETLGMGIAGASLGTGVGYLLPAVGGVIFFVKNRGILYLVKPTADFRELRQSCLNGVSEMVSQISTAVTTFFFNLTMMRIAGENGVAAVTVMIYSQFLLTTLFLGFSMGVAPVFSYQFGHGDRVMMRRIFRICLAIISILSVGVFVISLLCGPAIAGLFDPGETDVFRLAREGFRIFSYSFLFCGFNIFASALFTALSNGKVSAVLSFLRTFGFLIAALLLLPPLIGIAGVWLTVPLAEMCAFVVTVKFLAGNKERYGY